MTYQPRPGNNPAGGPTSVAATGTPSYASFPSSSPYSASSTQSLPHGQGHEHHSHDRTAPPHGNSTGTTLPHSHDTRHLHGETSFHHERSPSFHGSAPGTPHHRSARPVYPQVPAGPPRLPTSLNGQPRAAASGMQYPATPYPGQIGGMMPISPMGASMGMGGMGMGMGQPMFTTPGMFYRNLGYQYNMAHPEHQAQPGWSPWDFAQAIGGGRLERSWFDDMLQSLPTFFSTRRLSVQAARDAHRRIYHELEIDPRHGYTRFDGVNNKVLGGAAAFEAFLIWDRHHYSIFHQEPTTQNRERLVGLAISHVYALFDRFQIPEDAPGRHGRSLRLRDACEVAAATAKSLFEDHYDGHRGDSYSSHHRGSSISESEHRREERERERERERMMRSGAMGGMGAPMGGMPAGIIPGGQYAGMPGAYAPGGHHRHHYRRDEFDSDEEDYARMRAEGMYRSQYPGAGGMMGPGMNPMMAQQAAMMNGMRPPPPTMGYGAPAAMNQLAAMQSGMMGQPGMMGQAGMMNPMMTGQMMNPAAAMGMNPMAAAQAQAAQAQAMAGMNMGIGVPAMPGQMMNSPYAMGGNAVAMYEMAQMSQNMGGAQAMPGMHVRDAERMVDPAFYNGGAPGGSWYGR